MSGGGGFRGRGFGSRGPRRQGPGPDLSCSRQGGPGGPRQDGPGPRPPGPNFGPDGGNPRMGGPGFNGRGGRPPRGPCPNFNPGRHPPRHPQPSENWSPRGGSPRFPPWRGGRPPRFNGPPRPFFRGRGPGPQGFIPRFNYMPPGNLPAPYNKQFPPPAPEPKPAEQKPAVPYPGSEEERQQKISEAADALKRKLSTVTKEPEVWREEDDETPSENPPDVDHDPRITNKGCPELKHDPPELNLTLGDLRDIGRVDVDHRCEQNKSNYDLYENEVEILAHNPVRPMIEIDLWSDDNYAEYGEGESGKRTVNDAGESCHTQGSSQFNANPDVRRFQSTNNESTSFAADIPLSDYGRVGTSNNDDETMQQQETPLTETVDQRKNEAAVESNAGELGVDKQMELERLDCSDKPLELAAIDSCTDNVDAERAEAAIVQQDEITAANAVGADNAADSEDIRDQTQQIEHFSAQPQQPEAAFEAAQDTVAQSGDKEASTEARDDLEKLNETNETPTEILGASGVDEENIGKPGEDWGILSSISQDDPTRIPGLDSLYAIEDPVETEKKNQCEIIGKSESAKAVGTNEGNDVAAVQSEVDGAIVVNETKESRGELTSDNSLEKMAIQHSVDGVGAKSGVGSENKKDDTPRETRHEPSESGGRDEKQENRAFSQMADKGPISQDKPNAITVIIHGTTGREQKQTDETSRERSSDGINRVDKSDAGQSENSVNKECGQNIVSRDKTEGTTTAPDASSLEKSAEEREAARKQEVLTDLKIRERRKLVRRMQDASLELKMRSRANAMTSVPVEFDPRAPPPNFETSSQTMRRNSSCSAVPPDFDPKQPPPSRLHSQENAEIVHFPPAFNPRLSVVGRNTLLSNPALPPPQDFVINQGYPPPCAVTSFSPMVPAISYHPPPIIAAPSIEVSVIPTICLGDRYAPLMPLPSVPITVAPPIVVPPDNNSILLPPLPMEPQPPLPPVKSGLDMDDGLEDMQEAMEFAKQFMNMNDRRVKTVDQEKISIDPDFFHMPTFPDLPPVELPALDPNDIPTPPELEKSTEVRQAIVGKESKKSKSSKLESPVALSKLKIEEKWKNANPIGEPSNEEQRLNLTEELNRPKVMFNLSSKTKVLSKDNEWQLQQHREEAAEAEGAKNRKNKSPASPAAATTLREKIRAANEQEDRRKSPRAAAEKSDAKAAAKFNGGDPETRKPEESSRSSQKQLRSPSPAKHPKGEDAEKGSEIQHRKNAKDSTLKTTTDESPEASWKSRVIGRFLKMSNNDMCNMLNNAGLRRFDIAMNHLVKERRSTLSLGMRSSEEEKLKDSEGSYNRDEFMDQLSAMLDPATSATVDIGNLPTQFLHHLNEVLQLESMADFGVEGEIAAAAATTSSSTSSELVEAPSMTPPLPTLKQTPLVSKENTSARKVDERRPSKRIREKKKVAVVNEVDCSGSMTPPLPPAEPRRTSKQSEESVELRRTSRPSEESVEHRRASKISDESVEHRRASKISDESVEHRRASKISDESVEHRRASKISDESVEHRRASKISDESVEHRRASKISDESVEQRRASRPSEESVEQRRASKLSDESVEQRRASRPSEESIEQRRASKLSDESVEQRRASRPSEESTEQRKSSRPSEELVEQRKSVRTCEESTEQRRTSRPSEESTEHRRASRPSEESVEQRRTSRPSEESVEQRRTPRPSEESVEQRKASRPSEESVEQRRTPRPSEESVEQRRTPRPSEESAEQRRTPRPREESADPKSAVRVETTVEDVAKDPTTMTSRAKRRHHHHHHRSATIPEYPEASTASINGSTSQETPPTSINMADVDDIFSEGIARAKKKAAAHASKSEKTSVSSDYDVHAGTRLTEREAQVATVPSIPSIVTVDPAVELDKIFAAGIARAKLASKKAAEAAARAAEANDGDDDEEENAQGRSSSSTDPNCPRHRSFSRHSSKHDKWSRRKANEDRDAFRNLTKEEWEAKQSENSDSNYERENRAAVTTGDRNVARSPLQQREEHETSEVAAATRSVMARLGNIVTNESVHTDSWTDNEEERSLRYGNEAGDENPTSARDRSSQDGTSSSSTSSSTSSGESSEEENAETPSVTKLLKVIKAREKIGKKRSVNEEIRDEVTAEMERKRRERGKVSRKGHKSRTKKSHRRKKDRKMKVRERKKRDRKRKKRKSRKSGSEEDESTSGNGTDAEGTSSTTRRRRRQLLTEEEIKKEVEDDVVVVKDEPENAGEQPIVAKTRSKSALVATRTIAGSRSSSTSSVASVPPIAALSAATLPAASGSQMKTKAQLKQLPGLPDKTVAEFSKETTPKKLGTTVVIEAAKENASKTTNSPLPRASPSVTEPPISSPFTNTVPTTSSTAPSKNPVASASDELSSKTNSKKLDIGAYKERTRLRMLRENEKLRLIDENPSSLTQNLLNIPLTRKKLVEKAETLVQHVELRKDPRLARNEESTSTPANNPSSSASKTTATSSAAPKPPTIVASAPTANVTTDEITKSGNAAAKTLEIDSTNAKTLAIGTTTTKTPAAAATSTKISTVESTNTTKTSEISATSVKSAAVITTTAKTLAINTTTSKTPKTTTITTAKVPTINTTTTKTPVISNTTAKTSATSTTISKTPTTSAATSKTPTISATTSKNPTTGNPKAPITTTSTATAIISSTADSAKVSAQENAVVQQSSSSKPPARKLVRQRSLTKATEANPTLTEARVEAGKFAHIKSEGRKELKLREKLKKGRQRVMSEGLETTIPLVQQPRLKKRPGITVVKTVEESELQATKQQVEESTVRRRCEYFGKGVASDGFPDIVPQEFLPEFTREATKVIEHLAEPELDVLPPLPMAELSTWPLELPAIAPIIAEGIDSDESPPFKGFAKEPILRRDRVLTEAEISSEINELEPVVPLAFETSGADALPMSTVLDLNDLRSTGLPLDEPISYGDEEFVEGRDEIETTLLGFSVTEVIPEDPEAIAALVDDHEDDFVARDVEGLPDKIPEESRESLDVLPRVTSTLSDSPAPVDFLVAEVSQRESIPSPLLVAEEKEESLVGADLPGGSVEEAKNPEIANCDDASEVTSSLESRTEPTGGAYLEGGLETGSLSVASEKNVSSGTKIAVEKPESGFEARDVPEKRPVLEEFGAKDDPSRCTTLEVVHTPPPQPSSSSDSTVNERNKENTTGKEREASETRNGETKPKESSHHAHGKSKDQAHSRSKRKSSRHHNHGARSKKSVAITEKMVEEAVAAKIVKLVPKPTSSKETVMARMIEIDVEIHKLMNEKMTLYKMLESGKFPSGKEDPAVDAEVSGSGASNVETKAKNDVEEHPEIVPPTVLASRLVRDLDKAVLPMPTNVQGGESSRKTDGKKAEAENEGRKRKRQKSPQQQQQQQQREAKTRAKDTSSSREGHRQRKISESKSHSRRITSSEESSRQETTSTHSREKSTSSTEHEDSEEKIQKRKGKSLQRRSPNRRISKRSCEHSSKEDLSVGSRERSSDRSVKSLKQEARNLVEQSPRSKSKKRTKNLEAKRIEERPKSPEKKSSAKTTDKSTTIATKTTINEGERGVIYSDESTWDSVEPETNTGEEQRGKKDGTSSTGLALLEESFKREMAETRKIKAMERRKGKKQELRRVLLDAGGGFMGDEEEHSRKDSSAGSKAKDKSSNTIKDPVKVWKHVTTVIDAVAEDRIEQLYNDDTSSEVKDSFSESSPITDSTNEERVEENVAQVVGETTRTAESVKNVAEETEKAEESKTVHSKDPSAASDPAEEEEETEVEATTEVPDAKTSPGNEDEHKVPEDQTSQEENTEISTEVDDPIEERSQKVGNETSDKESAKHALVDDNCEEENAIKSFVDIDPVEREENEETGKKEEKLETSKEDKHMETEEIESFGASEYSGQVADREIKNKTEESRSASPEVLSRASRANEEVEEWRGKKEKKERPKDEISGRESIGEFVERLEKSKEDAREAESLQSRVRSGRSGKRGGVGHREASPKTKKRSDAERHHSRKNEERIREPEPAKPSSRPRSATKRRKRGEKSTPPNRRSSRYSEDSGRSSRGRRRDEKSSSRGTSPLEGEPPRKRANHSRRSSSPFVVAVPPVAMSEDHARRRARKRKRRPELSREEMISCKVLLIDCKYTYLSPNMHPRILKKLGISKVNPYTPPTLLDESAASSIINRVETASPPTLDKLEDSEETGEVEETPMERPSSPIDPPSSPKERPSSPMEILPIERPASPKERPSTPKERPSSPEDRPSSPKERPSSPTDRPSSPKDRPSSPTEPPPSPKEHPAFSEERSTPSPEAPPSPKERPSSATEEASQSVKEHPSSSATEEASQSPTERPSSAMEESSQTPNEAPASPIEQQPLSPIEQQPSSPVESPPSPKESPPSPSNRVEVDEDDDEDDVFDDTIQIVKVADENLPLTSQSEDEDAEGPVDALEEQPAPPDSTGDDGNLANDENVQEPDTTDEIEVLEEKITNPDHPDEIQELLAESEPEDEDLEPQRTRYTVHKGPILDIKVLDDSFLAASEDGAIYRYSQKSNGILNIYKGHEAAVTCIYVLETAGKRWNLYSGSLDGSFRCYNITTGLQERPAADVGSPVQCMDQAWGVFFVGTKSGHISRYNIKSGSIKGDRLEFSDKSVLALKASSEGPRRILIVASRNQPITIRDALTGLFLRTICGYKNHTVYSLMRERNLVYCGTSSTSIPVFDFTNGEQVTQYNAGVGIVCMRLYRQVLFAGCYDGNIYVFDTKETKLICSIPGPGNMLLSMEIVGDEIIAGSKNRQLHSWRMPRQVRALLSERT